MICVKNCGVVSLHFLVKLLPGLFSVAPGAQQLALDCPALGGWRVRVHRRISLIGNWELVSIFSLYKGHLAAVGIGTKGRSLHRWHFFSWQGGRAGQAHGFVILSVALGGLLVCASRGAMWTACKHGS